jgi:hypothetical protein
MDFSTGNSGNKLKEAVVKTGPGCRQEGAFCQVLGSVVAPEIYGLLPDGYVMEKLDKFWTWADRSLLQRIEFLLADQVWCRQAFPVSNDIIWTDCLKDYGLTVPDWAVPKHFCLAHGDPTISNTLSRGRNIVLCDPRPPRNYIPQCAETDMGRILQSYFGWESVAYGAPETRYAAPYFFKSTGLLRSARFWCGAAAVRIEHLEKSRDNRAHIINWCREVRKECLGQ